MRSSFLVFLAGLSIFLYASYLESLKVKKGEKKEERSEVVRELRGKSEGGKENSSGKSSFSERSSGGKSKETSNARTEARQSPPRSHSEVVRKLLKSAPVKVPKKSVESGRRKKVSSLLKAISKEAGVACKGGGNCILYFRGRSYRKGDSIESFRIVRISMEEVVLKRGSRTYKVSLF